MAASVIFHNLVQQDLTGILRYYADEADKALADRFYDTFLHTVDRALSNPQHFHFLCEPV